MPSSRSVIPATDDGQYSQVKVGTPMRLSVYRSLHPLASAVRSQMGRPPMCELLETLRDASRCGADRGFTGFIWYRETVPFAKRHRETIVASLRETAAEFGERDAVSFVMGFRCVKDADVSPEAVAVALYGGRVPSSVSPGDVDAVLNGLAWYALETVAAALDASECR